MNKFKKIIGLFLFLLSFIGGGEVRQAQADILLTPTRVVFEGRDRFKVVTLVNTSGQKKAYDISWEFFRMQEEGTPYESVENSVTEFDLSKHVVFSPRRVTLLPGAKQKMRLALRRPAELADGDYRAHLKFTAAAVQERDLHDTNKKASSAAVLINVGYSIPVLLRSGTPDATAEIESLSLKTSEDGSLVADVSILRKSVGFSVLGHLKLYYTGADGREEMVAEVSNAHIFPEVGKRTYEAYIAKPIGRGRLRAVLYNYDKENPFIYAEKTFPVQ